MPNGTYGGVRGKETKVGQKTFVSRPTRLPARHKGSLPAPGRKPIKPMIAFIARLVELVFLVRLVALVRLVIPLD